MKLCTKCNTYKDYSEFCKDRSRPDGLEPRCRKCRSRAINKVPTVVNGMKFCPKCGLDKPLTYFQAVKDRPSGYRSHCKACFKEYRLKWYTKNHERELEKGREYYSCNIEAYKLQHSRYKKMNRHVGNASRAKRRAQELKATPKWLTKDQLADIKQFYKSAKTMSEFHEIPFHVDHIEPLLGKTSTGLHVPWNLRVIPAFDNLSKGNKLIP